MRAPLRRRDLIVGAGGLLGAAGLAACGAPPRPAPTAVAPAAPSAAPPSAAASPAAAPAATTPPPAAAPAATAPPPAAATTAPVSAPATAASPAAAPSAAAPSAAATKPAAAAAPTGRGTIQLAWGWPDHLNTFLATSARQFDPIRRIHSRLVQWSKDLQKIQPELATTWSFSDGDPTMTFKLNKDARWHDGQPLTARDVVYTLSMAMHPATGSRYRSLMSAVVGYEEYARGAPSVAGFEAPDPQTLVIKTSRPSPELWTAVLPMLAIMPEHILKDVAPDKLREHPQLNFGKAVGSGAYRLASVGDRQFLELERWERLLGQAAVRSSASSAVTSTARPRSRCWRRASFTWPAASTAARPTSSGCARSPTCASTSSRATSRTTSPSTSSAPTWPTSGSAKRSRTRSTAV